MNSLAEFEQTRGWEDERVPQFLSKRFDLEWFDRFLTSRRLRCSELTRLLWIGWSGAHTRSLAALVLVQMAPALLEPLVKQPLMHSSAHLAQHSHNPAAPAEALCPVLYCLLVYRSLARAPHSPGTTRFYTG